MVKTLRFLLLTVTLAGGGILLSQSISKAEALDLDLSLQLPETALDLSDLDLRDELNRPIHSAAIREKTKQLFIANLNHLLLFNMTPQKRDLLILLSQRWKLSAAWLKTLAQDINRSVDAWFQNKKSVFLTPVFLETHQGLTMESSSHWRSIEGNRFLYLLSFVLSSTCLLR